MAGSAGNWYKVGGKTKGKSVYISAAQRGGMSRGEILAALTAGDLDVLAMADRMRPSGVATSGPNPRAVPVPTGKNMVGWPRYANTSMPKIEHIPGQPQIIITAGMMGAGKTTVRQKLIDPEGWDIVDADALKLLIPGYDPKNPFAVHSQSKKMAFEQLNRNMTAKQDMVWDVTGVNPATPKMIRQLQDAGYKVTVVHVDVPLELALSRNAARERSVDPWAIEDVHQMLPHALDAITKSVVGGDTFAVDNQ